LKTEGLLEAGSKILQRQDHGNLTPESRTDWSLPMYIFSERIFYSNVKLAMLGRSEYIAERWSRRSLAILAEFNTMRGCPTTSAYTILPVVRISNEIEI
jgi:hypothetical protein